MVKFTALNSKYKLGILEANVVEPFNKLIIHINMGQDTGDMTNYCLI